MYLTVPRDRRACARDLFRTPATTIPRARARAAAAARCCNALVAEVCIKVVSTHTHTHVQRVHARVKYASNVAARSLACACVRPCAHVLVNNCPKVSDSFGGAGRLRTAGRRFVLIKCADNFTKSALSYVWKMLQNDPARRAHRWAAAGGRLHLRTRRFNYANITKTSK